MELSSNEKKTLLLLKDEMRRTFFSGADVKPLDPRSDEYVSWCYGISRVAYPGVLYPLGMVLYSECEMLLKDGFPEGPPEGHGDAVVYWILSEGLETDVRFGNTLKKISLPHLKILSAWLKTVALPLYAQVCYSEIKSAEKIIETLCRPSV